MPGEPPRFEIVKTIGQRIFLLLAALALIGGLARFTYLRFQSGDVYPAYSTLRTDPVGAKALFESFQRVRPEKVRRNVHPLTMLQRGSATTLVMLGADAFQPNDQEKWLQDFAGEGGRVLIALDARDSRDKPRFNRRLPPPPPITKGGTNTNVVVAVTNFNNLFGLDLTSPGVNHDTNLIEAIRIANEDDLPESMPWFGRYAFTGATNDWETVYALNGRPVVLQQKRGLGRIILVADSYPFSNEAMRTARTPEFLVWALGAGRIVFDETHLGIEGGSGVAALMREFRLHGLVAGVLLLAALWIWRNSSPLVPPPPAESVAAEQAMEGKTAREAIVHLLRRNLTGADALRVGVDEWAKANPPHFYWETVRLKEAQELAKHAAATRKPNSLAALHRQLSELLFPKQH